MWLRHIRQHLTEDVGQCLIRFCVGNLHFHLSHPKMVGVFHLLHIGRMRSSMGRERSILRSECPPVLPTEPSGIPRLSCCSHLNLSIGKKWVSIRKEWRTRRLQLTGHRVISLSPHADAGPPDAVKRPRRKYHCGRLGHRVPWAPPTICSPSPRRRSPAGDVTGCYVVFKVPEEMPSYINNAAKAISATS